MMKSRLYSRWDNRELVSNSAIDFVLLNAVIHSTSLS